MKFSFNKIIVLSSLFLLTLASCRKESTVSDFVNPNSRISTTYAAQFETVWQGMDQGYVFWGHDSVDWDERYRTFKPVFDSFDRVDYVSQAAYQAAYTGLFEGLLDHHLFGIFYAPGSGGQFAMVSPGQNDYAHNTYSGTEREKELDALQKRSDLVKYSGYGGIYNDPRGFSIEVPGNYFALIKGKKQGDLIAYFRFTDFHLSEVLNNYRQYVPSYVFGAIKDFYGTDGANGLTPNGYANNDSVVGIIIDLRGNGGGSTSDLAPFIGCLAQSNSLAGYTRVKDGFGRLDYSPWTEYYVGCPSNHLLKEKPVVALVDINSVSCAELATMIIKGLPQGKVIGERTYGAIGALLPNSDVSHDMFYSGCMGDYKMYEYYQQYSLDDLINHVYRTEYKGQYPFYIYTSTFNMVDKDFNQVEGVGVQPDIEVFFNRDRLWNDGVDVQLQRAINYIKTGR